MKEPERRGALLSADTSAEVEAIQIDLWKRMSSIDKAFAVSASSRAAQELSLAGIRLRHPDASETECRLRLAVLKLGSDLARRVYPEAGGLSGF
jgi:hypothetical protein